ncbi:MAG: copper resistance protein CopC [Pseudonocardia sp.]|nr:copper resistance protein CopC [Pseudonocardia sp.]
MRDGRAPRRIGRWLRNGIVSLLLTAAGLLASTAVASAHAVLTSTDPAGGSVLPTLPPEVSATFAEAVELPPNAMRVFDPNGVEIDNGKPSHPPGRPATVRVGVHAVATLGSYTVAWRVISADTHPVSGAFTFAVGHPSATLPIAPPGGSALVGVLYWLVRAVAYSSYAVLIGTVALLLLCWPAGAARRIGPRVAALGWATLVPATVATLLLQGPYGNATGLGDIFEPGTIATTLQLPLGSALIARLLLLIAVPIYLGQLVYRLPQAGRQEHRWFTLVGVGFAVGLAATWSVSGHAAVGLQPGIALPVDIAHLVAIGTWLGGLAVLALALREPDSDQHAELADAVGRFSPIAMGCVAVLVATGTYQSWRQLGTWTAFLATDYGRILLIKIIMVGALLTVGNLSRRAVKRTRARATAAQLVPAGSGGASRLSPPHGPAGDVRPDPRLVKTVLVEAAIAAVVLALTSMLVNAEPGRTAVHTTAQASAEPVRLNQRYDTGGPHGSGSLEVAVSPARSGPNSINVTVYGPAGVVVDVPELKVELSLPARGLGPLPVTVARQDPGRYRGDSQIPFPGTWQLALTVRTSDIDETTVRLPVEIHP